ncbi:MAG: diguanylate cyclase [Bacillota bacterium]|nr:diguanylate cyclase [Bacillota bacterium]
MLFKRWIFQFKIQDLFLNWLVGIQIFFIILIFLIFYGHMKKDILTSNQQELRKSVYIYGQIIDFWLQERLLDLKILAEHPDVLSLQASQIQKCLASDKQVRSYYENVLFLDTSEHAKASLNSLPNIDLRPVFEGILTGQEYISDFIFENSKRPLFLIAVPVQVNGTLKGVLVAVISPVQLVKMINLARDRVYLVGERGTILFFSHNISQIDATSIRELKRNQLSASFALLEHDWKVIATRDLTPVFEKLKIQMIIIFLLLSPFLIILIILTRKLLSHLSGSLQTLTSLLLQVAAGQTGQRAYAEGQSELSVLGKAFNNMVVSLETMKDQLNEKLTLLEVQKAELEERAGELEALQEQLYNKQVELMEKNRLLQEMFIVDQLTKLYNRSSFLEQVKAEIKRAVRYHEPLVLAMIDVDFFKTINDTFGHPTGDLVLREIAKVLKGTVRRSDLLGRYGGDEFILLAPNTDLTSGIQLAERIRENMERCQIKSGEKIIKITASIGLATWQNGTIKDLEIEYVLEDLLERADQALYFAKNKGRNRVEVYVES